MPYFNVKDSAPITYQENGIRKIYNFVAGNSGYDNHLLYTDYWDGTQWQPADLGLSGTFPISSFRPAAITYQEGRVQKIYNFIYRSDNHVWVNWWDGSQWQWADLGSPGSPIITDLSAITFEEAGIRKLYVFAVGANNHLWINWWNGSQWQWTDQGSPGTQLIGRPAVITYSEGGRQKIYVFASGDNNHLNVYFWDGIRWQWADQGDTGTRQEISAITYDSSLD